MGKGEKRRRDAMGVRPTRGTRSQVLAWADANSLDISNDEADDLVRRLRNTPSDETGTDAPDGDGVEPGTADGEGDGRRPLRYDRIYPLRVSAGGEGGTVRFAPFDGCVRIERGGRRATVVALDDLSEDDRSALARTPVRRRVEVHVRCSARGCAQAYRAFLSPPSASGDEIAVEDTAGERICGFAGLFAARCPAHRRGQGDRM
jgi:hypothetical protein